MGRRMREILLFFIFACAVVIASAVNREVTPSIALLSPRNGATGLENALVLTWAATPGIVGSCGACEPLVYYRVYIAEEGDDYADPVEWMENWIDAYGLSYGTTYLWKVEMVVQDTLHVMSEAFRFSTKEVDRHHVSVSVTPPETGRVRLEDDVFSHEQIQWVEHGKSVIAEAEAMPGYGFSGWLFGDRFASTEIRYRFFVVEPLVLEATFVPVTFRMGNTMNEREGWVDESPVHGVVFAYDFFISSTELTFEAYGKFCADTGVPFPGDSGWGRGNRPIINVSWYDAIAYCNWLSSRDGYARAYDDSGTLLDRNGRVATDVSQVEGWRLPTEAEWEYAARGGSSDIRNGIEGEEKIYAGSDTLEEVGWYSGNADKQSHPVGEKAPNEYGIYDLSGNVWEWCHDRYGPYPGVAAVNPIGPETGDMRAIRGGAWSLAAPSARIANRNYASPVRASNDLGFRIARTLF